MKIYFTRETATWSHYSMPAQLSETKPSCASLQVLPAYLNSNCENSVVFITNDPKLVKIH